MKRTGIGIWLLAAVMFISGCGKQADNGKGINSGKTVDKVIESQVKKEEQKKQKNRPKKILRKMINRIQIRRRQRAYRDRSMRQRRQWMWIFR